MPRHSDRPPAKSAKSAKSTKTAETTETAKRRASRAPARARGEDRGVTLADVAKIAGVSPITVSRVVNQPDVVAPDTVARVREAIQRTGYVPNLLAGGLASRRSRLIAAIVPTIVNSIFADTVQALTDRLSQAGYQTMLGLSGYAATREQDLLAAILSRRPDGIVLTGIVHTADTRRRLLAARIPVVETWDLTPTPIDMLVGFSHERVGQQVATFLYGRGYRRFAILSASDQRAEARRLGFLETLGRHGITEVPSSIVPAPSSLGLGREALARLLDGGARPDVVFCSSDTLAQGALAEAHARGLAVPRDLAVMGFGDLNFAAHTYPPLSTVRIDGPAIGRQAADRLLARIDGKDAGQRILDIGFEVVVRASA